MPYCLFARELGESVLYRPAVLAQDVLSRLRRRAGAKDTLRTLQRKPLARLLHILAPRGKSRRVASDRLNVAWAGESWRDRRLGFRCPLRRGDEREPDPSNEASRSLATRSDKLQFVDGFSRRLEIQSGKSIMKRAPAPTSLWAEILPSCCSTICFTIARPRPVPRFFVEKKGSKMRSSVASSMPLP